MVNSSQFIIGDWLNFGREKWDRAGFKKRVDIAEVKTGLDPDTLRVYSCLARRVPFENRNPKCSFQHHRIVAKLEPQEQSKWLNIAEKKAMTGKRLKASIVSGKPLSVEEFTAKKNPTEQPHNYGAWALYMTFNVGLFEVKNVVSSTIWMSNNSPSNVTN